MASTINWKVYTSGTSPVESPGAGSSAANVNLLLADVYDSGGTAYAANPVAVPPTGSNYSFERITRAFWTGTFNEITNEKFWKSSGTLSDAALKIQAATSGTFTGYPISGLSTWITSTIPITSGTALIITPAAGSSYPAAGYSKYVGMQLVVPSTVTTPGDIGSQLVTIQWDET